MADGIRRVLAIGKHIVERLESGDRLVLAKGDQEVRKFVLGNIALADRFRQCHENGMLRRALVTGIKLALPLVKQRKRSSGVSHLVAKIVRDPAVRVYVKEMLTQMARQKPACHRKILVMRASQPGAVCAGLGERWRSRRNCVCRRQTGPSESSRVLGDGVIHGLKAITDFRSLNFECEKSLSVASRQAQTGNLEFLNGRG